MSASDPQMQFSDTYWFALAQVLGMLGSVVGKRVVELGAGIGRFTGELARHAQHVLAVDFMENLIAQNRENNVHCSNVEWRQADATQLQVRLGKFVYS